ncbi:MAG: hypothetical protein GXY34_12575 [Syntrophomonadaceae bacterium]|nr:hypothetical protein [Syntrophomonadaceae bacterium]
MRNDILFHGIIEGQGRVISVNTAEADPTLMIDASAFPERVDTDESMAVNGVCLTVQSASNGLLTFNLWPATLEKTNLSQLEPGMAVNLEKNRRASSN